LQHRIWWRDHRRDGSGRRASHAQEAGDAQTICPRSPRTRSALLTRFVSLAGGWLDPTYLLWGGTQVDHRLVRRPRGLVAPAQIGGVLGLLPPQLQAGGSRRVVGGTKVRVLVTGARGQLGRE